MCSGVCMVGAYGDILDATDEIQDVCNMVKLRVEDILGNECSEYKAVKYRVQIVAGQNFLIKVHVGGENYIHLDISQSLDGQTELRGLEQNKTSKDELRKCQTIEFMQIVK